MKTIEEFIIREIEQFIDEGWDIHQDFTDIKVFSDEHEVCIFSSLKKDEWFNTGYDLHTGSEFVSDDYGWWIRTEEVDKRKNQLLSDGFVDQSDTAQLVLSTFKL